MDALSLHSNIVSGYEDYIRSFIDIADKDIRQHVENELNKGTLWPDPLVQFNPSFQRDSSVAKLVNEGVIHNELNHVFSGYELYTHQTQAITQGASGKSFIVTSGTGSGKSLTYLGTIFDHLFRVGTGKGVKAILVYPMNALINSQNEELTKFAENYKKETGKDFPISFSAYTGQTAQDLRQSIQQDPPDILLTNYMMLELMLTRQSESTIRKSIYAGLHYLVFDELHTYRGRQGADVGMLIRRIKSQSTHELTCIGTSATMVSDGTLADQKKVIAGVGELIFGSTFQSEQIIGESLCRSIATNPKLPQNNELTMELSAPFPTPFTKAWVKQSALGVWLENQVALEDTDDGEGGTYLKRGKPQSIPETATALAEYTSLSPEVCEHKIKEFLTGIHDLNADIVANNSRDTLLPFRLHQFFAQTGSVYVTLGARNKRYISLSPGLYHSKEEFLFPHVFSRASGHTYICVTLDQNENRLVPREFSANIMEEDGPTIGYIIPEYEESDTHWNPDEQMELLPTAWVNVTQAGRVTPKKDYKDRLPARVFYDTHGNYEFAETSTLPCRGWFMKCAPKGLLFDPTAGLFFSGNTNERTKLTTLGNEGRSTSTTVSSYLILKQLAAAGFNPKDQKLLSFTDNRQDAALQAGHFNDFMRVARIRGAIAHAVSASPGGLNYQTLGPAIAKELGLSFHSYAKADETVPEFLRDDFNKALETFLIYHAIYDIRRGWRVVLPNLEKCGLLEFDYENLDKIATWEEGWSSIPVLSGVSIDQRREFLFIALEHFRRDYAVSSPALLEPITLEANLKLVAEKLRKPWVFQKNDDFTPSFFRLEKLHPRDRRKSSTLGLASGFGKFTKALLLKLDPSLTVNRQFYEEFINAFLGLLKSSDLIEITPAKGPGGAPIDLYQLKLNRLIWKAGDKKTVQQDQIKHRSFREIQEKPNTFFQSLYLSDFSSMKNLVGEDHTGQLSNDDRLDREDRFRADWYRDDAKTQLDDAKIHSDSISALFCSPTMELGIDISNLSVVHMRNAPPNPANYAQRSGRAGRSGQAALVFTYCSSYSPHDRHYFAEQDKLVAGSVEAPKLDLTNRELIESHLNALALAEVNLGQLKDSVTNLLDHKDESHNYPMLMEIRDQLQLGAQQKTSIRNQLSKALGPLEKELTAQGWFTDAWVDQRLSHLETHLDRSLDRWRSLYTEARAQLTSATKAIESGTFAARSMEYRREERRQRQAYHCLSLLRNDKRQGGPGQLSEFYVFRYLASEGFLPGYNFTRLPIRVFVAEGDAGEYISRPRLIALREFGPRNILYHQGQKFSVNQVLVNDPSQARQSAKVCLGSGYWLEGSQADYNLCPFTGVDLTNTKNRRHFTDLLPLSESRATRRENITCEEEERSRLGFEIETYFSMPDGDMSRVRKAHIFSGDEELLHLSYIPAAKLIQVNIRDKSRNNEGFLMGLETGVWHASAESVAKRTGPNETPEETALVMPFTHDTADALYIEPLVSLALDREGVLSLQYALKRAIETHFQIEPSELGVTSMGGADTPNIFIYEAAEGSLGILNQLATNKDAFKKIIEQAIKICRFDDTHDVDTPATYDDLLSYYNQPHHRDLDRWAIKDALDKLKACRLELQTSTEPYEDQYQRLCKQMDQNSSTEAQFLKFLYDHGLRLPDSAQKTVDGIYVMPDFFYEPDVWVFCDGTPHDDPSIMADDKKKRKAIKDRGDEVIIYYYKDKLEDLVAKYPDVFTPVR